MNLAIVINTTDKYSFLWEGFWYYFKKNWEYDYPVYFLNEKKNINFPVKQIKVNISDIDLWTKKLRESIKQIPEDDIFLLLEDIFIIKKLNEFENIYQMFKTLNADALRIRYIESNLATYYDTKFRVNGIKIRKLKPHSKYLIAYSPNIWKKSFLLECLKIDESCWQNEITGSTRIEGKGYNIYSYLRPDWYINTCVQGKITSKGRKLLDDKIIMCNK